jgi:flavin prenyltransferase
MPTTNRVVSLYRVVLPTLLDLPEPASLFSCVRASYPAPRFGNQRLPSARHSNPLPSNVEGLNLTVATTGASGSLFLKELLRLVDCDQRIQTVNFIASDSGLRVMAEELEIQGRSNLVSQLLGHESRKIHQQSNGDIGANVASGSYPTHAMIVIPCSVGTLGRIASGIASQLIERAADVCLKEKRPLVLCVRETPLNKIHIRNMYRAADTGATIFPLIPTFYNHPSSQDEMARQFASRVLAHIGLPQPDAYRWKG